MPEGPNLYGGFVSELQPSVRDLVLKNHKDFMAEFPEFDFTGRSHNDSDQELLTMSLAFDMARESRIHEPVQDISHRRYVGRLIVAGKSLLRKLCLPFIRILFVRQQRLNDLSVSLAYSVASLELRIARLEQQLEKYKGK